YVRAVVAKVYEASYSRSNGFSDRLVVGTKFKIKVARDGSATGSLVSNNFEFDATKLLEGVGKKMGDLTISATVRPDGNVTLSGKFTIPYTVPYLEFSFGAKKTFNIHGSLYGSSGLIGNAARALRSRGDVLREACRQSGC
ncbi:MAG: hypothetical protein AB8G17_17015, partial [Gammaproteobacteria bacterium]